MRGQHHSPQVLRAGTYLRRRCRAISAQVVQQAQGMYRGHYHSLALDPQSWELEVERSRTLSPRFAASFTSTIVWKLTTAPGGTECFASALKRCRTAAGHTSQSTVKRGQGSANHSQRRSAECNVAGNTHCPPNNFLTISRNRSRWINAAGIQDKMSDFNARVVPQCPQVPLNPT